MHLCTRSSLHQCTRALDLPCTCAPVHKCTSIHDLFPVSLFLRVSFLLLLLLLLPSCSSGPPDELFTEDIRKMAMIEREMGFRVQVDDVEVLDRRKVEDRVEVDVRVTGWATHPDITIGAVLPASTERQPSWASWKYFCRKAEKTWVVEEKYKVQEGFGPFPGKKD